MLYKVFISQWKYPVKGDCTEEVKTNMKDFEIDISLDELKLKSTDSFRRIVKIKTKEFTMNYLLQLKDGHTKMDNLNYGELGLQSYLKDSRIPVAEARNLYR